MTSTVISHPTYRIWVVRDETDEDRNDYYVRLDEKGWICSCVPLSRGHTCEHILTVKEWIINESRTKS